MMDILYLMLILVAIVIKEIENVLLKKDVINSFAVERVLFVSEEPSILQCAQRCRYIDKNAIIDFKEPKCTCTKYEPEEGQEIEGTLTGVFVNHEIMKLKKVDGGWSGWKYDGVCSVTCGEGFLKQVRTCTNPVPSNGGADCIGRLKRDMLCDTGACPCIPTTAGTCCRNKCVWNSSHGKETCYDTKGTFRICK